MVLLKTSNNLRRDTLRKITERSTAKIIALRLEYSEKSKLLSSYVDKLIDKDRLYPTHLPTQSSYRWSTLGPPSLTNLPRKCVNPQCVDQEHEWTDRCWSIRDIMKPEKGMVMFNWDHDNAEGRIHDLYLNDVENLKAHASGFDLHTITCCYMFHMDLPSDLRNPHTSAIDSNWRRTYNWQGKDTQRRVLAKNFNHGSKYTLTPKFVYTIPDIEKYNIKREELYELAKTYMYFKRDIFEKKRKVMQRIKREKVARNLYGARRLFYDSSHETGKEGFSFIISSTVSLYNNETLIMMKKRWPQCQLMHNAHDGDKVAFPQDEVPSIAELKGVIERPVEWEGRSIVLTAGIKIHIEQG